MGPRAPFGLYGYWGSPFFYYPYYHHPYYHHPYWGHPYWGPPGMREGQLNPALAKALGLGALDLRIKPRGAEVFVDGTLVGKARDFDGYPSYLWMGEGEHTVTLSKNGYATYEQTFDIQSGVVSGLKLKLQPGESEPSDPAPGDEAANGSAR